ncbi:hypothetical protein DAEQUDRAFT_687224 [Daedalea quercina L-15889]|uniref:F-box domain-containing protein n=1 Tax=Daedalea quercina L-15889 TaxID=1314783 RepID=A0A165SD39_9APHY|nr:hypothetical protein DAEQUDRAFT_687224 [Daedalea quercina L-15889]
MPQKKAASAAGRNPAATQAASRNGNGRKNVRGKRGGLKDMPSMPLDILLEIFRNLEPRDLLNLARTTRPFREFLMNRDSASMWKASRANIEGLPDCPPYLSEPAYANLVFFSYCHNCFKSNVQTVLWEFSKRYCPACTLRFTQSFKDIKISSRYDWVIFHIKAPDLGIFSLALANDRNELYHCPQLDEIKLIWEALYHDKAAWTAYVAEQRKRIRAVSRHAELCRAWDRQRAANRSAQLHEIRKQRLETIVAKLRDLGWGEELDRISAQAYHPLCYHAQVRPPKPLTDRAWTKIQNEVVTHMQEIKDTRLRTERRELIYKRLVRLKALLTKVRSAPPKRTAEDEYKPKFQDLAMMPEIRELIEAPNEVTDCDALQVLLPKLPALEERWRQECRAELMTLLSKSVEAPDGVDPLELAATVFQCKDCARLLQYPVVLSHECRVVSPLHEMEAQHGDYVKCAMEICDTLPWSVSSITISRYFWRAGRIVRMCGKDPAATTQKEMDEADVRLVYQGSTPESVVMSWRRAIKCMHRVYEYDAAPGCWKMATEEEKAAVKVREDEVKADMPGTARLPLWRCGHCDISRPYCWSFKFTLEVMKHHLRKKHAIEDPTVENGDMYLHPDNDTELEPISIREISTYEGMDNALFWSGVGIRF